MKLTDIDLPRDGQSRSVLKYDFQAVVDHGKAAEYVRGEDYAITDANLRATAFGWAKRMGYKAHTSVTETGMLIQFTKITPKRK